MKKTFKLYLDVKEGEFYKFEVYKLHGMKKFKKIKPIIGFSQQSFNAIDDENKLHFHPNNIEVQTDCLQFSDLLPGDYFTIPWIPESSYVKLPPFSDYKKKEKNCGLKNRGTSLHDEFCSFIEDTTVEKIDNPFK